MDWSTKQRQTLMGHENLPGEVHRIIQAAEIESTKAKLSPSQRFRHTVSPINIMLTKSLILTLIGFVCQTALASMSLPDGIENMLGFVPSSNFKCERDGYFGDIENDCRIFHLCQKQIGSNGKVEWRHWTYACGNQTMFNQLTLTCAFVDEAIPCRHASQFQYLNEVIHKPREPFLTDADVTSGISYYTNRIMSDGARNRAFEDSKLMAQLGGSFSNNQQFSQNEFVPAEQNNNRQFQNHQTLFQQQNSNLNLNFQQPPQQSHQQQGVFFSVNNNNQLIADTDDSSGRTFNSIEMSDLPLSSAFHSLSRQATVAANSDRQPGRQQALVLINHSANHQQHQNQQQQRQQHDNNNNNHHHRHHQQQEQPPQLQFFAFPESGFVQSGAAPEPVLAAAPVTALPATSGASVAGPSQEQQQQQRQVNVQQQPSALASFNFAVSTDHQLGPSTSSHSTLFTNSGSSQQQQQQQQQQNHLNFQTTVPTLSTSAQATQVPSLPTTAPTTASFTTAQPSTTTTFTIATTRAPIVTAATTTTPANSNAPTSTSTSSRQTEPTTTSFVTTTTNSASTTTTTTANRAGTGFGQGMRQLSRSSGSSAAAGRINQGNNRRGVARSTSESLLDSHPMRHFQSNRLSAMKQQGQPQAATESALVMRRQRTTTVAAPSQATSQPVGSLTNIPISSIDESEAFWRRPFDVQLMQPRFESLLMRRRV